MARARIFITITLGSILWTATAIAFQALPRAQDDKPGYTRVAVFGTDQRTKLSGDESALAKKIGILSSRRTGAVCTAFCAAPDIIVTASHCLFGTAVSAKPDLTQIQFELSGELSSLAGLPTRSTAQHVLSGTRNLSVTPPIAAADDWAVARLARPVCRDGGLAFTESSSADIEAVAQAGGVYEVAIHRDISEPGLMLSRRCDLPRTFASADEATISRDFKNPGGVVFHDCDTGGGSSGSPLLINGPSGPEVIAINVGTYVLSRETISTTGQHGKEMSEAIANTGVSKQQFAEAVDTLKGRHLLATPKEVRALEADLTELGFYRGALRGQLTPDLEAAIEKFESRAGQPSTGLIRRALPLEIHRWANASRTSSTRLAPRRP